MKKKKKPERQSVQSYSPTNDHIILKHKSTLLESLRDYLNPFNSENGRDTPNERTNEGMNDSFLEDFSILLYGANGSRELYNLN